MPPGLRFHRRNPDPESLAVLPKGYELAEAVGVVKETARSWCNGTRSPRVCHWVAMIKAYDLEMSEAYAWAMEFERRRQKRIAYEAKRANE